MKNLPYLISMVAVLHFAGPVLGYKLLLYHATTVLSIVLHPFNPVAFKP